MKIEHIAIWTPNLEPLKSFYETFFQAKSGSKYINNKRGFESYFLTFESDTRLELMYVPNLEIQLLNITQGYAHFAIAVGSKQKVDSLTQKIRTHGFPIISDPRYTGDGYYESEILDPDGNHIEITI